MIQVGMLGTLPVALVQMLSFLSPSAAAGAASAFGFSSLFLFSGGNSCSDGETTNQSQN
jgi:hypothetical protein